MLPERKRSSLVKQDPHPDWGSGGLNASSGMLEYGVNLLASDPGKPFQELIDRSAALEIFEQCAHRDPGTAKYPRPTEFLRVSLDSFTGAPFQHSNTLL